MLTPKQAEKLAEIRFGEREDVDLAVSIDGSVTLSIGWWQRGRRKKALYAVRVGYHFDGPHHGGFSACYLKETWEEALASFLRASGARVTCCRPQTWGSRYRVSARCADTMRVPSAILLCTPKAC